MFIALNPKTATDIQEEFKTGTIRKEYLARVRGEFPACVFSSSSRTPFRKFCWPLELTILLRVGQ